MVLIVLWCGWGEPGSLGTGGDAACASRHLQGQGYYKYFHYADIVGNGINSTISNDQVENDGSMQKRELRLTSIRHRTGNNTAKAAVKATLSYA